VAIWIVDLQGRVLTATHPEYLDQDYASHPAFVRGNGAKIWIFHNRLTVAIRPC